MRTARILTAAALTLGTLGLTAPAAGAADDPRLTIHPRHAAPGSTVTVSTNACGKEKYGKGESAAAGKFHLFGSGDGVLTGHFKVPADAEPGTDEVLVKCPPRTKLTGTYRIVRHRPGGPVDAGSGGMAGTGSNQLALGGLLLAGAAAGGIVTIRRRRAEIRD